MMFHSSHNSPSRKRVSPKEHQKLPADEIPIDYTCEYADIPHITSTKVSARSRKVFKPSSLSPAISQQSRTKLQSVCHNSKQNLDVLTGHHCFSELDDSFIASPCPLVTGIGQLENEETLMYQGSAFISCDSKYSHLRRGVQSSFCNSKNELDNETTPREIVQKKYADEIKKLQKRNVGIFVKIFLWGCYTSILIFIIVLLAHWNNISVGESMSSVSQWILGIEFFSNHINRRYNVPCSTRSVGGYWRTESSSYGPLDDSEILQTDKILPTSDELRQEFFNFTRGHVPAPSALEEHSKELEKEIIQVVDDVYVAIGYGLANCIIINGTEGIVVIDTMESAVTMEEVWADWLKFSDSRRPVSAIIYTHFHADHIFGSAVIYEHNITQVHAHELTKIEMAKVFTRTAGMTYRRSMKQFGVFVPTEDFVSAGIGPRLKYESRTAMASITPTDIMTEKRKKVHLGGVDLELIHAPGESKDQLVVWYQKKDILIGADNLYKAFPNIYAIRGTETRDCIAWIESIDLMRSFKPQFLILGHTRPLIGKKLIEDTLTAYRDAIQYVHDQTIRLMNKGYYLNDIAHMVRLPPHLEGHPYLQQFYGTVPWAVRAIFTHYMGWFSGNPEDLLPMSTIEKAEALIDLAGGLQPLLKRIIENIRNRNYQWALELATAANHLFPENDRVKTLKALALRAMASIQSAATDHEYLSIYLCRAQIARNWYLTSASELEQTIDLRLSDHQKRQTLSHLSLAQIFDFIPVRLMAEDALKLNTVLLFNFNDTNEQICIHFRSGIAYHRTQCEKHPDVEITTSRKVWIDIINKERNPALAVAKRELEVKGSILTLIQVLAKIELDVD